MKDKLRVAALSTQDYYRQILRLVYRLLFLFVAEDRNLLLAPDASEEARSRYSKYYSTSRLRRLADHLKGTRHSDLYDVFRLVTAKLGSDNGCRELGLPALNGFLFSKEAMPDLESCELSNADLLDTVRALGFLTNEFGRRPVDYKNLRSEELGSVYEALLELHPRLNTDAGTFELTTAAGHERKATGSYYTPESLVLCLLDSALDPVLEEACRKPNPEEAILHLKVCDPACGSGHFPIAAAHRMAKRLASIRTGDEEPAPSAMQRALRDVISHCIYGVDQNPMAVELCKVALWMESLEPGKPLSFLDHHIQCGNSLLGTTPALLKKGIPDEVFTPIGGDDKDLCRDYKKQNKEERSGIQGLPFEQPEPWMQLGNLATTMMALDTIADDSVSGVRDKQQRYEELVRSSGYLYGRMLADAWCAAFVWKKSQNAALPYPITEGIFRKIERNPHSTPAWMKAEIQRLTQEYKLFHWHLAFPDVFRVPASNESPENVQAGWSGGFDVVLGNPPWERLKIQEKEWFAERRPDIANAPNAAQRKRMIQGLQGDDPVLYSNWLDALRESDGESHLIRNSGRYPLCGRGDINTYSIFAEMKRGLLAPHGRVGSVLPTGIATDDTTKHFFRDLIESRTLHSLYDFQSGPGLFAEVGHARFKFSLVTMRGYATQAEQGAEFAFFLRDTAQLHERNRRFRLTSEDIALLNPNTRTCPIFRSERDAELAKGIYRHVDVLIREAEEDRPEHNPWGIRFSTMFHMANDSYLFCSRQQLEQEGWRLAGNVFEKDGQRFLPLYEAKMLHHYTYRYGDYRDQPIGSENTSLPDVPVDRLCDAEYSVFPKYWVSEEEVLLHSSQVPEALLKAYRSRDEQLALEVLAVWFAGYFLKRGNEQIAASLIQQFHGSLLQSAYEDFKDWLTASAIERNFPLTDKDVVLLQQHPSALSMAQALIESRSSRWFLGWRRNSRSTDERTFIATMIRQCAVGDSIFLMVTGHSQALLLQGNLSSFGFDFAARQKLGGANNSFYIVQQLPVLKPVMYIEPCPWHRNEALEAWIIPRLIELNYSSWELKDLAVQVRYAGPPFVWNEQRRFMLRCEIDAAYFHLYSIDPEEVDYIMDTFHIVKRRDEQLYGEYRTKRVILEIYSAMAEAICTGQPYQSGLNPPPGPPIHDLPDWPAGGPQPANWPSHIHSPHRN